jgi:outer membrane protein
VSGEWEGRTCKPLGFELRTPNFKLKRMKNISTLLNIVALVLIGVLFYLLFSQREALKKKISDVPINRDTTEFRIAYFDIDSLQTHYEYFKDAFNQMKARENAMNSELNSLTSTYQRKIKEWQEKGTSMTQSEGEAAQREYAQMQQKFQNRKLELQQGLEKQQMDLMTDIRKKVEDYLKEYNKEKGYAFILSYEPGVMLYYRNPMYDITSDLIAGLNEKYKGKKK